MHTGAISSIYWSFQLRYRFINKACSFHRPERYDLSAMRVIARRCNRSRGWREREREIRVFFSPASIDKDRLVLSPESNRLSYTFYLYSREASRLLTLSQTLRAQDLPVFIRYSHFFLFFFFKGVEDPDMCEKQKKNLRDGERVAKRILLGEEHNFSEMHRVGNYSLGPTLRCAR